MIVKAMTFNIQHGLDYKELLNKKRIINLDKVCDLIKQNKLVLDVYKTMTHQIPYKDSLFDRIKKFYLAESTFRYFWRTERRREYAVTVYKQPARTGPC